MIEPAIDPAQVRIEVLKGISDGRFAHEQDIWLLSGWLSGPRPVAEALRSCGTSGCIAGWAALVAAPPGAEVNDSDLWLGGEVVSVPEFGQRALGLSDEGAQQVFFNFRPGRALARLEWLAAHPEAAGLPEDWE